MLVPYEEPVRSGHVAFVASGGNCPGLQQLVGQVFRATKRIDSTRKVFGLRNGLLGALRDDNSCLVEITESNLNAETPFAPPIVSFGKGGPGHDPESTAKVVRFFLDRDIKFVVKWGGNFSLSVAKSIHLAAEKIAAEEGEDRRLILVCLPKSVDNDAHLPPQYSSIGFMTAARALGLQLVDLANDARNSENLLHVPVLHGNQVGFLTERAARLSSTPLFVVPEMLDAGTSFEFLIDILIGATLKRAAANNPAYHNMVPVAEGVLGKLDPDTCPGLREALVGRKEGIAANVFPLCARINEALTTRLAKFLPRVKMRCRSDYYGYTARGSNVLHETDRLMTEVLGQEAVEAALLDDESGIVVIGNSREAKRITLAEMFDNGTGDIERELDVEEHAVKQYWQRNRKARLVPQDLASEPQVVRMAEIAGIGVTEFRSHFAKVAEWGAKYDR